MARPNPSAARLEEVSDRSMPGRQRHLVGTWICRAADGVTSRANSCSPSGATNRDLQEAVDEVEAWFRARGLPPRFQVWDGTSPGLCDAPDRRGYSEEEGAEVLVRDLSSGAWPASDVATTVADGMAQLQDGATDAEAARLAELDLAALPKVTITAVTAQGHLMSRGVGVLDGDALGIFAMATAPEHRRQGRGAAVLAALLEEGRQRGAELAWLQVMQSNAGALRLYRNFGFEPQHRYHYRLAG